MIARPGKHLCRGLVRLILTGPLFLVLLGLAGPSSALAGDEDAPVSIHQLLPQIKAEIQADGGLALWANGSSQPLLTARVPVLTDNRRVRGRGAATEFTLFNVTEGVAGGQRGFSTGADDDGDGLVDEDWLDGRDNDGDGLVDEDFAAIGDNMAVVHRQEGTPWVHLESYHWSYPRLRSAVFLSLATDRVGLVALEVAATQGSWIETDISTLRHSVTGKPSTQTNHPFVTRLDDSETGPLWVAVMVLGDRPGYLALGNDRGNQLDFPLSEMPLPLVVCAARSWLQLTTTLGESDLLFRGMADPLNNQTAGWIVPPSCSGCRSAGLPSFSLQPEGDRSLLLRAAIKPGQSALIDPDLFQLDGRPLGSPEEILWRPASGSPTTMAWKEVTLTGLRNQGGLPNVPYAVVEELMGHQAEGVLEFRFHQVDLPSLNIEGSLTGRWLEGRPFKAEVMAPGQPVAVTEVLPGITTNEVGDAVGEQLLAPENFRPTLSPDLLDGWPNPFRDVIQIKFQVPGTVGEAFVWVNDDDFPKNLDPQSAVPWKGGSPNASIKIYNINGQELMTLHDGSVSQGEFTVNWNGTDIFGRQVASGTYFCKLQLDDWSVTRRIVYLR